MVKRPHELKIKIFADGAEKASMLEMDKLPFVKGFTTNPTLMRKAGITDYVAFAKEILSYIKDKPVSFEVFSDDFSEMERQARIIASWGPNVYVKIPITNTAGKSSFDLVKKLAHEGVKLNVTAILTAAQVKHIKEAFPKKVQGIVSVFAGRVADTGHDPFPMMVEIKDILSTHPNLELLWASPRQLLDIYKAEQAGSHIITVTPDIIKKLEKVNFDHNALSLETVKMFYDDGQKVGYSLYEE